MTNDHAQIRELQRLWLEAVARGDIDTLLDLVTDDVEFITANRPPYGKEQFANDLQSATGKMLFVGSAVAEELEIAGHWAYAKTRIDLKVTPSAGGETKKLGGLALSIFRKEPDGKWRLARDANLVGPID